MQYVLKMTHDDEVGLLPHYTHTGKMPKPLTEMEVVIRDGGAEDEDDNEEDDNVEKEDDQQGCGCFCCCDDKDEKKSP